MPVLNHTPPAPEQRAHIETFKPAITVIEDNDRPLVIDDRFVRLLIEAHTQCDQSQEYELGEWLKLHVEDCDQVNPVEIDSNS